MADMQAIIDAIYTKLTAVQTSGTLYADVSGRISNGQPKQDETMPLVRFFLATAPVFITFESSNAHGSILQVDYYHNRSSGAKACRALADKGFALLNRVNLSATGWGRVQLLCTDRGEPEVEEDAFRVVQQYSIGANAT